MSFLQNLREKLPLNLLANFLGQGWSALMSLAFIPVYIQLMGIEAYGLVGFYVTLQSIIQILDFGFSPTMNREMARYLVRPEMVTEARNFARTLEIGYWIIGLLIGLGLIALAPFLATSWIQANTLASEEIQSAILSFGIMVILQWPLTLYLGGLQGLQRQVELNSLQVVISTLRNLGAALVLWLIKPTVGAFLAWQIFINSIQIATFTWLFWKTMPQGPSPRFHPPQVQLSLFMKIWRFAVGISGITFTAIILTQMDKVILSKLITLEKFGYYLLATTFSTGFSMLIMPVFNLVFSRLTTLATVGNEDALKRFYHQGAQTMMVIIVPLAAVVIVYAFEIVQFWTNNTETAQQVAPLVSLLVIGTALNSLMYLPYALQLAYGLTSLSIQINLFLIAVFFPTLISLTLAFDSLGAASTWIFLNCTYIAVGIPLTHRRLLSTEAWRWLWQDIASPLSGTLFSLGVLMLFIPRPMPWPVATLFFVWVFVTGVTILFASHIRQWVFERQY